MPQVNNKALKFAPAENGEKRVELAVDGDETIIKLSTWADGLGWCVQKTMQIDADLLDEMHGMIGAARVRLRNRALDEGQNIPLTQKVLNFPVIA